MGIANNLPYAELDQVMAIAKRSGRPIHYINPSRYFNTLKLMELMGTKKVQEGVSKALTEAIISMRLIKEDVEIEALDNAPGVYTARWAGEPACDANNRKKALAELADKSNRNARFRTVITLIRGDQVTQVEGEVRGAMATEERGTSGFGYDALFIPEGDSHTFGELPADIKNTISHRARALEQLKSVICSQQ